VEGPLVFGVPGPVGVGPLDDDLPLFEEPGDEELDVELRVARLAQSDQDVVDVDEEGETLIFRVDVGNRGCRDDALDGELWDGKGDRGFGFRNGGSLLGPLCRCGRTGTARTTTTAVGW
jgi:hypothetical protein